MNALVEHGVVGRPSVFESYTPNKKITNLHPSSSNSNSNHDNLTDKQQTRSHPLTPILSSGAQQVCAPSSVVCTDGALNKKNAVETPAKVSSQVPRERLHVQRNRVPEPKNKHPETSTRSALFMLEDVLTSNCDVFGDQQPDQATQTPSPDVARSASPAVADVPEMQEQTKACSQACSVPNVASQLLPYPAPISSGYMEEPLVQCGYRKSAEPDHCGEEESDSEEDKYEEDEEDEEAKQDTETPSARRKLDIDDVRSHVANMDVGSIFCAMIERLTLLKDCLQFMSTPAELALKRVNKRKNIEHLRQRLLGIDTGGQQFGSRSQFVHNDKVSFELLRAWMSLVSGHPCIQSNGPNDDFGTWMLAEARLLQLRLRCEHALAVHNAKSVFLQQMAEDWGAEVAPSAFSNVAYHWETLPKQQQSAHAPQTLVWHVDAPRWRKFANKQKRGTFPSPYLPSKTCGNMHAKGLVARTKEMTPLVFEMIISGKQAKVLRATRETSRVEAQATKKPRTQNQEKCANEAPNLSIEIDGGIERWLEWLPVFAIRAWKTHMYKRTSVHLRLLKCTFNTGDYDDSQLLATPFSDHLSPSAASPLVNQLFETWKELKQLFAIEFRKYCSSEQPL